jgi:hypothetical protein
VGGPPRSGRLHDSVSLAGRQDGRACTGRRRSLPRTGAGRRGRRRINKTDTLDARGLNQLQRNGTLPMVWIPPGALREHVHRIHLSTRGRPCLACGRGGRSVDTPGRPVLSPSWAPRDREHS